MMPNPVYVSESEEKEDFLSTDDSSSSSRSASEDSPDEEEDSPTHDIVSEMEREIEVETHSNGSTTRLLNDNILFDREFGNDSNVSNEGIQELNVSRLSGQIIVNGSTQNLPIPESDGNNSSFHLDINSRRPHMINENSRSSLARQLNSLSTHSASNIRDTDSARRPNIRESFSSLRPNTRVTGLNGHGLRHSIRRHGMRRVHCFIACERLIDGRIDEEGKRPPNSYYFFITEHAVNNV